MKQHARILSILLALPALSTLNSRLSTVHAQGTAFTYQGQLQNNGSPVNGTYNLTFTLFNTNASGTAVASPVTNSAVAISNGLFTVTIGFGSSVWNGQTNWLEIGVETNNGTSFTTLAPRQQVTPTPYAITAQRAGTLVGTIPSSQLTSFGNSDGGSGNFFIGSSGNPTTSGSYNTANGVNALVSNTSGSYNTVYGYNGLLLNTSGSGDTAIGYLALYNNTSGYDNTAIGYLTLFNNTNGIENTANGAAALHNNTSGNNNIGLGYNGGSAITTGSSNVDIGNPGLSTDTNIIRIGSGQTQTFLAGVINGNGGGLTNLNASQLTSIGNPVSAYGNFFVGPSGNATTVGFANTAIGTYAFSLNTSGSDNTANGFQALYSNTSGNDNTANGFDALVSNTNGSDNTADGFDALIYNTSGSQNTASGSGALYSNTSGNNNVANGAGALYYNTNGSWNTANGQAALLSNTSGSYNVANGWEALYSNTTGSNNTANGYQTLYSNASGLGNSANGGGALYNNTSGSVNTANGYLALFSNTNGSENTADGTFALGGNTSGTNNIALGYQAGFNITTGSSNIDIGNEGVSGDTNVIRIGDGQTATYLVGNVYTPSGTVQSSSDRNVKEDFAVVNPQQILSKVASLPVTEWNYKTDKGVEHIGPMAQDFHAAFGLNGADDRHISVVDEGGVALAAVQGLNQKLEEQAKEKDAEIADLKARLDALEKIVLKQKLN